MVGLIRAAHKQYLSSSPTSLKTLILHLHNYHYLRRNSPIRSQIDAAAHSSASPKSPFTSYILRILRNEISYLSEYAPPYEPDRNFNSFTVQDLPGHQLVRLRSKFGENEDIKIAATMFNGHVLLPRPGSDNEGLTDLYLHLSLSVDISKSDNGDEAMRFICSMWPDRLEIRKVYISGLDQLSLAAYVGPDFKNLNVKLQSTLQEFLHARGVNNELSAFLHAYMWNKDKIELIKWLGDVQSFVEK